jgi:methylase of polypeptide subunit release factors
MAQLSPPRFTARYDLVTEEKASGATYTPAELADFVAAEMVREWDGGSRKTLKILDPAVGEGELLASLLKHLPKNRHVDVYGFDNNPTALETAAVRLERLHPKAKLHLQVGDFLAVACGDVQVGGLFEAKQDAASTFDLVIANPPYVRTQIMGADAARALAAQFGLTGRVDLYHAFILAIAKVLRPNGVAGVIVSNRFMTTKAGATVRRVFQEQLHLRHVWDLGDTKFFNAAVLPAVLIAEGLNGSPRTEPTFTSIYETKDEATSRASSIASAVKLKGVVQIPDGRKFRVQRGALDTSNDIEGVWRVATEENDAWLATVDRHSWGTFRRLGKVRVGVKTCADKVFIRRDWDDMPRDDRPELLRPLTTHHIGRRFRADQDTARQIVYPHECVGGKRRASNLSKSPRTLRYLESHREQLESRSYVLEAGRNWYELWVPQDPRLWSRPKLVFRDISEEPCFWIDQDGTIVNGDCYWLVCDDESQEELLWLALSVGNSTFIEAFYDHRFNNKLYAGRRRFITQYVEKFPLPDPETSKAKAIIKTAKRVYAATGTPEADALAKKLDALVWEAFGLPIEEV